MVSLKTVIEYLYFYYYLLQGAIFLFFAGRIETLKGNIDAVSNPFARGKVSLKSFRKTPLGTMFPFRPVLPVALAYMSLTVYELQIGILNTILTSLFDPLFLLPCSISGDSLVCQY